MHVFISLWEIKNYKNQHIFRFTTGMKLKMLNKARNKNVVIFQNENYRLFLEKLQQMVFRYDKYGYNYVKHVFDNEKN